MSPKQEYNPNDYVSTTEHAMRFVKKLTRANFNNWVREFKVRIMKRDGGNVYLRPDLTEALEAEMRAIGERK